MCVGWCECGEGVGVIVCEGWCEGGMCERGGV